MDNDEIMRIQRENEAAEPDIDPEVELAWDAEIERRIRQVDSGQMEVTPGEVVMARLRARLKASPRTGADSNDGAR